MNEVRLLEGRGARVAAGLLALCAAWLGCGGGDAPTARDPGIPPSGPTGGMSTVGGSGATGVAGGFGNPTAGAGGGNTSGGGSGKGGQFCAEAMVTTSITEPDILFVVDGSGSMCASFGGGSRWSALRSALLDPTEGLIFRLQQTVDFGLLLYDGTIDIVLGLTAIGGSPNPECAAEYIEQKAMGECPQLIQVPIALNNAAAIDMAFPMRELGGSTPTDRAMNTAVDQMIAGRQNDPDTKPHPQYIILATDGQPNDICVGGAGGDGAAQKAGVISAVDRAAMNNITTFVISLAGDDSGLQAHLDEVAKHGEPNNPMAHTFTPESPMDLVNALAAIVGGAVGCDITLNGKVRDGAECRGTVQMNGTKLACCRADSTGAMQCDGMPIDPPDGWLLKDASTIQLVGPTCTNFLSNPQALLTAGFPCDVFVM